jgi:hypothetical protein
MSLQKQRKNYEHANNPDRLRRGTKNDRVYRILLCDIGGTLTKYRIAKLAHAQQIQVSLLLRDLEKSRLVSGTHVIDQKGLLTRWSRLKIKHQSQSYMLPSIMEKLKKTDLEYGLTTYRAESIVNGYLFPSRTDLYIRADDFDDWHALLVKAGALVGGGNVRLWWYDDQVLYNSFSVDGYRVVTIPQLIVDLLREGSSAVEAAELMMQKYMDLLRLNRLHSNHLVQPPDPNPR